MVCNMCDQYVQVDDGLLDDLDRNGRCTEGREHAELAVGSVDLRVPTSYDADRPAPAGSPVLLVALEISQQSIRSGFARSMLNVLLQLLDVEDQVLHRRVCVITFGDAVEFYAPTKSGGFRIVAMQAVSEPFMPIGVDALFIDTRSEASLKQLRALLEHLCDSVSSEQCQEATSSPAGGAALRAAVEAVTLAGGGDVWMCHASSPSSGIGAIKGNPDDEALSPCRSPTRSPT
eukprot:5870297-Amphidinium_carterae.1